MLLGRAKIITRAGTALFLAMCGGALAAPMPAKAPAAQKPMALVTIAGGTQAEQKRISAYFTHQLAGLTDAGHPLAVEIVPETVIQKMIALNGDASGDAPADTAATGNTNQSDHGDDAQMDQPGDGMIDGIYTKAPSSGGQPATITLLKGEDLGDLSETFLHEYGHHLWSAALFDQDRAAFRTVYKKAQAANSFVSDYASVSAEEDFAESFAYFEQQPEQLWKRDPAAARFMSGITARIRAANAATAAGNPAVQIVPTPPQ